MTRLPATTDNQLEPPVQRVLVPLHRESAKLARRPGWATTTSRVVRVPILSSRHRSILQRLLTQPGTWMHLSDVAEHARDRQRYGTPAYSVLTRVMAATRDMAALMAGAALDGAALATEPRERTA